MAPISRSLLGSSGLILIVLALVAFEGTRPASAAFRDRNRPHFFTLGTGSIDVTRPRQGIFDPMQHWRHRGQLIGEGGDDPAFETMQVGGVLGGESSERTGVARTGNDYPGMGRKSLQQATRFVDAMQQNLVDGAERVLTKVGSSLIVAGRNPCGVSRIYRGHENLLLPTSSWIENSVSTGKMARKGGMDCNISKLTDRMFNAYEDWYLGNKVAANRAAAFNSSAARAAVRLLFSSAAKWGMRGPKWRQVACLPSYLRKALTFRKCNEHSGNPYWKLVSEVAMCHPMKQVVCSKLLKASATFQKNGTQRQRNPSGSFNEVNEEGDEEEEGWRD